MRKRYNIVLSILLTGFLLLPTTGKAQGMQQAFDNFLDDIDNEFYTFLDSLDLIFADYLEQPWQAFEVEEAVPPPSLHLGGNSFGKGKKAAIPLPLSNSSLFFGQEITLTDIPYPDFLLPGIKEKEIAAAWRSFRKYDFTSFYHSCYHYDRLMQLNDWGYFLLLRHIIDSEYAYLGTEEQLILSLYLFTHAGFKVKAGYTEDYSPVLLIAFNENIYDYPFIRVNGEKFYLWSPASQPIKMLYTFTEDYPKERYPISMLIKKALRFPEENHQVTSPSLFSGMILNKNLLEFYDHIPLCDLLVYFQSEVSPSFKEAMSQRFLPIVEGKTEFEKIAFFLETAQSIAIHKKDEEVHGKEKYYFPEEIVCYPYADCEDFTLFLSWLIRNYISCEVIILHYPGHIALAVEKTEGYNGPLFRYGNKEYIVCDPSLTGGKPGDIMPEFKFTQPVVTQLSIN